MSFILILYKLLLKLFVIKCIKNLLTSLSRINNSINQLSTFNQESMTSKVDLLIHQADTKFIITLMDLEEILILTDHLVDFTNHSSQLNTQTLVHFTHNGLLDQELFQIQLWKPNQFIMLLMELVEIDMSSKL